MHDRSIPTLREVVDDYDRRGYANPGLDPELRALRLTDHEKDALVSFLESLSGSLQRIVSP
jgi:cytochrome c peroxidase